MQFGAAVRLKGTWKSRDPPNAVESNQQADGPVNTSDGHHTEVVGAPELQVDEVEILGHSKAAVSTPCPASMETIQELVI